MPGAWQGGLAIGAPMFSFTGMIESQLVGSVPIFDWVIYQV